MYSAEDAIRDVASLLGRVGIFMTEIKIENRARFTSLPDEIKSPLNGSHKIKIGDADAVNSK